MLKNWFGYSNWSTFIKSKSMVIKLIIPLLEAVTVKPTRDQNVSIVLCILLWTYWPVILNPYTTFMLTLTTCSTGQYVN